MLHSQAEGHHCASLYPLPQCRYPVIPYSSHMAYCTTISILYKMGEIVVVILHIYGARDIFLLFYDNKDTESESTNINTEKNIKGSMGQQ